MKNLVKLNILLALFILAIFGCNKEVDPTPDPQPGENSIQLEGIIQIPDIVPAERIGTMEVVSGFFSNTVTNTATKSANMTRSAAGSNEKYCKVTTFPNVVQLHTVFNNGNPFMFGLSIGLSENANMIFNEESTAISLIFMNPLFTVSDPAKAATVVAKIKNAPSFDYLKVEMINLMYQGSLNNMTPNIEVENLLSYTYVINEVLLSLNENYQIQQNGLQVFENTRVGNEIQFKIRNRLKRYSTIYAYKYKDGQLTKTDIKLKNSNLGYRPFEWIDCGSYDWIECWMQIFTSNLENQITQETDFLAVNVDNAEKIYLKCYGLGGADRNFPTIDSEAYLGGALAMAKTAVFDIVKPTVEVVAGIKNFPKAGDLRSRDNDDPLYKLVMNYYEELFKSSSTYAEFLKIANSQFAKPRGMKTIWDITKSFLTNEKNVELCIEILKKHATLSVEEKTVLNKAFTAASQVKAPGYSLSLLPVVYSTLATDWVTEFRINVDGTTDNQEEESLLPVIKTNEVYEIGSNSAIVGVTLEYSPGDTPLIESGVYYSTNPNPLINGIKITKYTSYSFGTEIYDLMPSTKYYVQAYARNEYGMGYGDIVEFITLGEDSNGNDETGVLINGVR